ncbi:MAG: hypothetical protein M1576_01925 [Deltaproteobacteria bacterium]|jgi:hypothetical protein|nr:hypothetical protein [Deltaproteobacteria bacterium]
MQTTNIVIDILTFILASATGFLAHSTYKTAQATKEMVELEKIPLLTFSNIQINRPGGSSNFFVRIEVLLKNYSKVQIKYFIKEFEVIFDNKTYGKQQFNESGFVINPNAPGILRYPDIKYDAALTNNKEYQGSIKFSLEYYSIPYNIKKNLYREMTFSAIFKTAENSFSDITFNFTKEPNN